MPEFYHGQRDQQAPLPLKRVEFMHWMPGGKRAGLPAGHRRQVARPRASAPHSRAELAQERQAEVTEMDPIHNEAVLAFRRAHQDNPSVQSFARRQNRAIFDQLDSGVSCFSLNWVVPWTPDRAARGAGGAGRRMRELYCV